MDTHTRARRSALMAAIRSKDTTPEFVVRRVVFKLGYRYRLHVKRLPGSPDLVLPGLRKAIFVHGCFWHGHANCRFGRLPRSNLGYWRPKIAGNKERDRRNRGALRRLGWQTLVIWQCHTRDPKRLETRIRGFLTA